MEITYRKQLIPKKRGKARPESFSLWHQLNCASSHPWRSLALSRKIWVCVCVGSRCVCVIDAYAMLYGAQFHSLAQFRQMRRSAAANPNLPLSLKQCTFHLTWRRTAECVLLLNGLFNQIVGAYLSQNLHLGICFVNNAR